MKTKIDACLMIIAIMVVSAAIMSIPRNVKAYSYSGLKWNSYPVSVDVSDTSFPFAWATPVGAAMGA